MATTEENPYDALAAEEARGHHIEPYQVPQPHPEPSGSGAPALLVIICFIFIIFIIRKFGPRLLARYCPYNHAGWRRIAILSYPMALLLLISYYYNKCSEYTPWKDDWTCACFLLPPLAPVLVLLGRGVYLWIAEGFATDNRREL